MPTLQLCAEATINQEPARACRWDGEVQRMACGKKVPPVFLGPTRLSVWVCEERSGPGPPLLQARGCSDSQSQQSPSCEQRSISGSKTRLGVWEEVRRVMPKHFPVREGCSSAVTAFAGALSLPIRLLCPPLP